MPRSLVVAGLLLSTGAATLAAQTPVTTVRGIVRDSAGTPIASAEVIVGRRSALTSALGAFVVDSIIPGRYTLTVRKIGLTPVREGIQVPGAGLTGLSYRLLWAAAILPTVIVEGDRPGIHGTIALVGQRPAAGARVQLLGPDGREVRSDTAGRFAFPGLRNGSYMVRITYPQFSERRISVLLGRNEGRELAVNLLPSTRISSRADIGALDDLGKRLKFGMRMDRVLEDDLRKRGPINVCDIPQVRSVIGSDNASTTIIVNGTTVYRDMPVYSLCSWRADEVEMVEFAWSVCSDATKTVADLLNVWCQGTSGRIPPPRSLSGRTGSMSGATSSSFVIIWERR